MKNLSQLLRSQRIKLNKTLEDVAKECGVDKATVSRWEKGGINSIKINKIIPLSNSLNIEPTILLNLSSDEESIQANPNQTHIFLLFLRSLGYNIEKNKEYIEPIFDQYGITYYNPKCYTISKPGFTLQLSEEQIDKYIKKYNKHIPEELRKKNTMKKTIYIDDETVYGATTLKDINKPEKNNMALHVCINPEEVLKNRKELSNELNIPLSNWVLPWQKHTANIYEVTSIDKSKGSLDKDTSIMNVDAVYTTEPNILIGVFTADCVGILLVDETKPCICAIHSGWKGTAQAITDKCVKELIEKNKINPATCKAYFSPSILFDSLEVGMEVVNQIKELNFDVEPFIKYMPNDKAYIDNQGLNVQMLMNNSFDIKNIYPSSLDTKKEFDKCFSFRNDKQTGEHFTFGFIKPR